MKSWILTKLDLIATTMAKFVGACFGFAIIFAVLYYVGAMPHILQVFEALAAGVATFAATLNS